MARVPATLGDTGPGRGSPGVFVTECSGMGAVAGLWHVVLRIASTRSLCSVAVGLLFALTVPTGVSASASTAAKSADAVRGSPQRIIIDTDLSRWWDDATAVGMANVLQQRDEIRILAVMSDIRNPVAAAAIDAIDTAYGHAMIPVGAVADSAANTAPHGYSDVLAEELPHSIRSSSQAQPAVHLYRHLLATQPDHSVIVVAIGGDTNLAALLRSGPGQGSSLPGLVLVAKKVKKLVVEDGLFPTGGPPFTNESLDVAATKSLVSTQGWPTAIAWVDGLTGIDTRERALCGGAPQEPHAYRLHEVVQLRSTRRW